MTNEINNYEDMIDSRDVIARIEELESDLELASDDEEKEEIQEELNPLKELATEAEGYAADWNYGEQLIRDSYFTKYAQELAEDIGATNNEQSWPYTCIDWDQAANELKMDYTSVDFDGVDYWIR